MRKSLPKTRPSALSSRVASLPAALLAAAAGHPREAKSNGHESDRRMAIVDRRDDRLPARLGLLEGFLSRTDVADCAQYALQWLADIHGVKGSLCLVRAAGEQSLVAVGSNGLPAAAALAFSVSLDDWGHPLVSALTHRRHAFYAAPHSAADRRRRP